VKTGADVIKTGSEQISTASDALARRTETQAANIEETAAAVSEITSTLKETAAGASQARDAVALARQDAVNCEAIVTNTITAMKGIDQSSREITQIIGLIDEIAFQTNLLALNAGVEAARAGDVGRGFAVVASEVRALAQRSAGAAKQIKELIDTSRGHVELGVQLVGETGTSLVRIVGRVTDVDKVISKIAVSVQQQAASLQEISSAVNQMDQMTQQNAAMVEESNAETRSLVQKSDDLNQMVGGFKTRDGARAA
jgi:methyl-accepting chemotaxis protein